MKTQQRKIGQNRGRPRLWLEGQILTDAGFNHGDRWDFVNEPDKLIIRNNPEGKRKIAGKKDRPIIDIIGRTLEASFDCDQVAVLDIKRIRNGVIHITPAD